MGHSSDYETEERVLYHILLANKDLFAEYPRRKHLSCVRALLRQKPIWYTTIDSYHWLALNDAIMEAMDFEMTNETRTYSNDAVFSGELIEVAEHLHRDYFSDSGIYEHHKGKDGKETDIGNNSERAGGMKDRQTGDNSAMRGEEPEEYYEKYDIEVELFDEDEDEVLGIGLDQEYEDGEDVFEEEDKWLGRGKTGVEAEQEDRGKRRETEYRAVSDAHESEEEPHESEEEILRQKKRKMDKKRRSQGNRRQGESSRGESSLA
ncbi:hypothetical protein OBBRIDRAFT_838961 [Obba rivulosa]|uniref:Uncharacterized protein n=1 Tax=Obba rivulosa TaxID=1052685 RepID=A0A8E2AUA9_9APHY|nr:hypothetical protein OBBRIDRAFT_838961 [Obba rivulosa]